METFRLILVFLHIFLCIFALVNFNFDHHDEGKKLSKFFDLTTKILRLLLEHSASIVVIWFSPKTGSSLVRLTSLILIEDLLSLLIISMNFVLTSSTFDRNETIFLVFHHSMLIIALFVTHRFAAMIDRIECGAKRMNIVLYRNSGGVSMESYVEPVAL